MGVGLLRSYNLQTLIEFTVITKERVYNSMANTSKGVLFLPPSDAYVSSFLYLLYTLIKLYYTKALSDQASSQAPDWIPLLWRPKIWASLHGSVTTFHLGGVLQDKVRMLGALVPCSPSKHIFCSTLLTLWCACVTEWHILQKAHVEPCSAVLWRPHMAYGRYLLGVYNDLSMPRGTHDSFGGPIRNGQSIWTKLSFSGKNFGLFDQFRTPWN